MIFVTVEADLPFNGLVRAMDLWSEQNPARPVFAQVGHLSPSEYRPVFIEWTESLSPAQFDVACAESDIIVGPAAMGLIISALKAGKPIVVMPRASLRREQRSEHQFATVKRLGDKPGIFPAWAEDELPDAIHRALAASNDPSRERLPEFAPPEFTDAVRGFILGHHRRH